jgi:lantibiotic modifying enzyme
LDSSTTKGRLAWCYCDIGIIGLYLKLYRILGQNAHLEMALLIGENSTKIDFNDSGIIDTSICHGLSGLCLIYKKLYEFTGSEIIKTSLESYLNLLISSFEVNINSEFTSPFNLNIERNYGIYEGIIGPRLVLNSFLFEIKTEWDEIFLNL